MLDFGCGSLRAGKLYIPYLNCGNYYGQEPNQWLIDDGVQNELGQGIADAKKPNFSNRDDFKVGFDYKFDYVVAQSIFSHTDIHLTRKGLKSIVSALKPTGIALVTIVEGEDYIGDDSWVYPECTTHSQKTIVKLLNESGGYWRRLWWFHPAQTWFAITTSKESLPSVYDNFFLLGGEEIGSKQYKKQRFLANRMYSLYKMTKSIKIINHLYKRLRR